MATTAKDTKVITGKVRFSYAHVFQPRAVDPSQDPKYSVSLLIHKSDKTTVGKIKRAIAAAVEAGKAQWGGKVPSTLRLPLRDGDEDKPESDEYAGHFFINASSRTRPGVVDADLNPIVDSTEFYSGCYGRASINFYAYNVSGNRGIAAGLNNLQKLEDGDYLGGRNRAEDDFSDSLDTRPALDEDDPLADLI